MKKWCISYLVFIAIFILTGWGAAQEKTGVKEQETDKWKSEFNLSPGVMNGDGDWTASLDYNASLTRDFMSQPQKTKFRKRLNTRFASEGTIAVDADRNTRPLTADARIAAAINLYKPPNVELGEKPEVYKTSGGFDLGRADFSATAAYETDQRFDNRNYTFGGEIASIQTNHQGLRGLIPSLYLGYDLVMVDHSQIQQDFSVDDKSSERLRAFAAWKLPIGAWISDPLDPLNLHIDLRYYKSEGLPDVMKQADQDEAVYTAGTLTYNFNGMRLWGIVNALFIRVADGRIPPNTDGATTVTIGVTLLEKTINN